MCGANFTVEHVFFCPRGGFPSIRHNEYRGINANLLTEICNDVYVEPDLQEVTTEELSGQSAISTEDIAANCFWDGGFKRTFLDIRVFIVPSNKNTIIEKCFRKNELEKKS